MKQELYFFLNLFYSNNNSDSESLPQLFPIYKQANSTEKIIFLSIRSVYSKKGKLEIKDSIRLIGEDQPEFSLFWEVLTIKTLQKALGNICA